MQKGSAREAAPSLSTGVSTPSTPTASLSSAGKLRVTPEGGLRLVGEGLGDNNGGSGSQQGSKQKFFATRSADGKWNLLVAPTSDPSKLFLVQPAPGHQFQVAGGSVRMETSASVSPGASNGCTASDGESAACSGASSMPSTSVAVPVAQLRTTSSVSPQPSLHISTATTPTGPQPTASEPSPSSASPQADLKKPSFFKSRSSKDREALKASAQHKMLAQPSRKGSKSPVQSPTEGGKKSKKKKSLTASPVSSYISSFLQDISDNCNQMPESPSSIDTNSSVSPASSSLLVTSSAVTSSSVTFTTTISSSLTSLPITSSSGRQPVSSLVSPVARHSSPDPGGNPKTHCSKSGVSANCVSDSQLHHSSEVSTTGSSTAQDSDFDIRVRREQPAVDDDKRQCLPASDLRIETDFLSSQAEHFSHSVISAIQSNLPAKCLGLASSHDSNNTYQEVVEGSTPIQVHSQPEDLPIYSLSGSTSGSPKPRKSKNGLSQMKKGSKKSLTVNTVNVEERLSTDQKESHVPQPYLESVPKTVTSSQGKSKLSLKKNRDKRSVFTSDAPKRILRSSSGLELDQDQSISNDNTNSQDSFAKVPHNKSDSESSSVYLGDKAEALSGENILASSSGTCLDYIDQIPESNLSVMHTPLTQPSLIKKSKSKEHKSNSNMGSLSTDLMVDYAETTSSNLTTSLQRERRRAKKRKSELDFLRETQAQLKENAEKPEDSAAIDTEPFSPNSRLTRKLRNSGSFASRNFHSKLDAENLDTDDAQHDSFSASSSGNTSTENTQQSILHEGEDVCEKITNVEISSVATSSATDALCTETLSRKQKNRKKWSEKSKSQIVHEQSIEAVSVRQAKEPEAHVPVCNQQSYVSTSSSTSNTKDVKESKKKKRRNEFDYLMESQPSLDPDFASEPNLEPQTDVSRETKTDKTATDSLTNDDKLFETESRKATSKKKRKSELDYLIRAQQTLSHVRETESKTGIDTRDVMVENELEIQTNLHRELLKLKKQKQKEKCESSGLKTIPVVDPQSGGQKVFNPNQLVAELHPNCSVLEASSDLQVYIQASSDLQINNETNKSCLGYFCDLSLSQAVYRTPAGFERVENNSLAIHGAMDNVESFAKCPVQVERSQREKESNIRTEKSAFDKSGKEMHRLKSSTLSELHHQSCDVQPNTLMSVNCMQEEVLKEVKQKTKILKRKRKSDVDNLIESESDVFQTNDKEDIHHPELAVTDSYNSVLEQETNTTQDAGEDQTETDSLTQESESAGPDEGSAVDDVTVKKVHRHKHKKHRHHHHHHHTKSDNLRIIINLGGASSEQLEKGATAENVEPQLGMASISEEPSAETQPEVIESQSVVESVTGSENSFVQRESFQAGESRSTSSKSKKKKKKEKKKKLKIVFGESKKTTVEMDLPANIDADDSTAKAVSADVEMDLPCRIDADDSAVSAATEASADVNKKVDSAVSEVEAPMLFTREHVMLEADHSSCSSFDLQTKKKRKKRLTELETLIHDQERLSREVSENREIPTNIESDKVSQFTNSTAAQTSTGEKESPVGLDTERLATNNARAETDGEGLETASSAQETTDSVTKDLDTGIDLPALKQQKKKSFKGKKPSGKKESKLKKKTFDANIVSEAQNDRGTEKVETTSGKPISIISKTAEPKKKKKKFKQMLKTAGLLEAGVFMLPRYAPQDSGSAVLNSGSVTVHKQTSRAQTTADNLVPQDHSTPVMERDSMATGEDSDATITDSEAVVVSDSEGTKQLASSAEHAHKPGHADFEGDLSPAEEAHRAIQRYLMSKSFTEEELSEEFGCPFVVLERLSDKDIFFMGRRYRNARVSSRAKCSTHCRLRTLEYLCELKLIPCAHSSTASKSITDAESAVGAQGGQNIRELGAAKTWSKKSRGKGDTDATEVREKKRKKKTDTESYPDVTVIGVDKPADHLMKPGPRSPFTTGPVSMHSGTQVIRQTSGQLGTSLMSASVSPGSGPGARTIITFPPGSSSTAGPHIITLPAITSSTPRVVLPAGSLLSTTTMNSPLSQTITSSLGKRPISATSTLNLCQDGTLLAALRTTSATGKVTNTSPGSASTSAVPRQFIVVQMGDKRVLVPASAVCSSLATPSTAFTMATASLSPTVLRSGAAMTVGGEGVGLRPNVPPGSMARIVLTNRRPTTAPALVPAAPPARIPTASSLVFTSRPPAAVAARLSQPNQPWAGPRPLDMTRHVIVRPAGTSSQGLRVVLSGPGSLGSGSRFTLAGPPGGVLLASRAPTSLIRMAPVTTATPNAHAAARPAKPGKRVMTEEERLRKRARLEKKYPLPPGVVIKTEPASSGFGGPSVTAPPPARVFVSTVSPSTAHGLSQAHSVVSALRHGNPIIIRQAAGSTAGGSRSATSLLGPLVFRMPSGGTGTVGGSAAIVSRLPLSGVSLVTGSRTVVPPTVSLVSTRALTSVLTTTTQSSANASVTVTTSSSATAALSTAVEDDEAVYIVDSPPPSESATTCFSLTSACTPSTSLCDVTRQALTQAINKSILPSVCPATSSASGPLDPVSSSSLRDVTRQALAQALNRSLLSTVHPTTLSPAVTQSPSSSDASVVTNDATTVSFFTTTAEASLTTSLTASESVPSVGAAATLVIVSSAFDGPSSSPLSAVTVALSTATTATLVTSSALDHSSTPSPSTSGPTSPMPGPSVSPGPSRMASLGALLARRAVESPNTLPMIDARSLPSERSRRLREALLKQMANLTDERRAKALQVLHQQLFQEEPSLSPEPASCSRSGSGSPPTLDSVLGLSAGHQTQVEVLGAADAGQENLTAELVLETEGGLVSRGERVAESSFIPAGAPSQEVVAIDELAAAGVAPADSVEDHSQSIAPVSGHILASIDLRPPTEQEGTSLEQPTAKDRPNTEPVPVSVTEGDLEPSASQMADRDAEGLTTTSSSSANDGTETPPTDDADHVTQPNQNEEHLNADRVDGGQETGQTGGEATPVVRDKGTERTEVATEDKHTSSNPASDNLDHDTIFSST